MQAGGCLGYLRGYLWTLQVTALACGAGKRPELSTGIVDINNNVLGVIHMDFLKGGEERDAMYEDSCFSVSEVSALASFGRHVGTYLEVCWMQA